MKNFGSYHAHLFSVSDNGKNIVNSHAFRNIKRKSTEKKRNKSYNKMKMSAYTILCVLPVYVHILRLECNNGTSMKIIIRNITS